MSSRRLRGQWIILTALAVVVAVAVIYMAYVSTTIVPVASIQRPAYGIMSQNWPELVQLLAGYAAFLSQSGASRASVAAIEAGLYNNLVQGHPADSYFQLQSASQYLGQALSAVEQSLIPLGTFVTASYKVDQGGFGGTVGPYPAAVVLSDAYNFTYWWQQGALSAPGAYRVYRFVVTPYTQIQSGYVVIYSADVRRPTAVGEPYSSAIADILNQARSGGGYDANLLKQKLYLILVNNTALREALAYYASQGCNYHNSSVAEQFNSMLASAFMQLPWWSEYLRCPFCLFDFKMPRGSLTSPGVSDEVMVLLYSQPTSDAYLTLNVPLMMSLFGITPPSTGPNFCNDPANYQYAYEVQASPSLNNNPYATYTIGGFQGFVSAAGLINWPSANVSSTCHAVGPQYSPTPIEQIVPTSVYGNATQGLLLGAQYPAGTYDVGYQIWNSYSIPPDWPGFQVRVLVNVTNPNEYEMGYLALFWGGYDGRTFPWCADMVAVQPKANPQVFTWSYLPQGYGSGPWQALSWQYGSSYASLNANRWYILSISVPLQGSYSGKAYLAVYKFLSNTTGPMSLYAGQWISAGIPTSFNVVLGTDVEDATEQTSWSNAAVYDFLAIRPWTYPEPSAVLTTLGAAPVVSPPRQVVLAWGRTSYVNTTVSALGNISLALVVGLNITQRIAINASAVRAYAYPYNATYVRYSYSVLASSNMPRSTLGVSFSLYVNIGGALYNYTCGVASLCNQSLVTYYGYFGGVDSALYNVTFLAPRYSSFSLVAQLLGAQLAVNNLTSVHPQVYYLWSGNSLYLVNSGNMDAVFYFPWQSGRPMVQSVSPNDGVFGAQLDVSGNGGSWTIVVVPTRSAVNVTFYPAYASQVQSAFPNGYAPSWELSYISPASVGAGCRLLQVYFPSVYVNKSFILVIPPGVLRALGISTGLNRLNIYIFSKGTWSGPLAYFKATWNDVWVNITQTPGWFAYRGTLLQICQSSTKTASPPQQVMTDYTPLTSKNPYQFNPQRVSLSRYPSGFAVVLNMTYAVLQSGGGPSNYLYYAYLANTTNPSYQCLEGTWAGKMLEFYNGYVSGISGWTDWWNQYASVCSDQYVWTIYGSGIETYFIFALTPQFANFHIATERGGYLNNYSSWWYNGWPNTAYSPALLTTNPPCTNLQQCNGPMWSFQYLVVGYLSGYYPFGVDVIPYMWPPPFFVLNGNVYQTI